MLLVVIQQMYIGRASASADYRGLRSHFLQFNLVCRLCQA